MPIVRPLMARTGTMHQLVEVMKAKRGDHSVRIHATGTVQPEENGRVLRAPVTNRPGLATEVVRALDGAGLTVDDIAVHQPSLDDVFLALTGHRAEADPSDADADPSDQLLEEVPA